MTLGATWLGVGVKSGGQLLFGGVESETGFFFDLSKQSAKLKYSMTSRRWGLGLGGSGGLSVILVFNSNAIWWLNGRDLSDWGVNLSLGGKWKDVAWFIADKMIHTILKLIVNSPTEFIKYLSELRDFTSLIFNAYDLGKSKDEHPILTFEVPFAGLGLEVSAFTKSGKIWIET